MILPFPLDDNIFSLEDENSVPDYSLIHYDSLYTLTLDEFNNINICYPFSVRKGLGYYSLSNNKFDIIKKTKEKQRKEKEDNIRKKIKTGFLKKLREIINNLLKKAGSKYTFESLPQIFIADISKKTNFEVLNLKYEEIFDYTYQKIINEIKIELVQSKNKRNEVALKKSRYKRSEVDIKKSREKIKEVALKKYYKNKKTLDYLNSNPAIRERSSWQKIRTMKYIDLLKAYFNSEEFEQSIYELYKKGNQNYINQYIFFSKTFVSYFQSYNPNSTPENTNFSTSSNPFETNYSNEMSLSSY
jgi:hypothetical protein